MSRAKEIQEKLELQAKLQFSFNNTKSKVLSWLEDSAENGSSGSKIDGKHDELEDSKQAFFNLPVMHIGGGLDLSTHDNGVASNDGDIHTIGEFIESDKKVNTLSKKKKRKLDSAQRNSLYRVAKDDSKSMVALKHKIRKDLRTNVRFKIENEKLGVKKTAQSANIPDNNSDSEDDSRTEKSVKKSFGLLFNGKKKR
ncbi:hypothetical protein KAFR_0B04470 [Kazachstania africana CBS 2517]|uniref:Nucleolar protein 19 n=1 Tax=Kazachstania africana (strain ATCC 22294 / BCRC 22015 / CBS 2517 / CECT 1963 / NBRC 1671 / NRRL Y-8276) TaxID=1071382 RepID=H2AQU3_KAZAF|nr:hypothetical protein KAFR_0B04470 [Kazachstania africana CBS 2517]CCF56743.1 hypothetical protein KAFR_0B04470 [Kazachstania africana CBS 2517]